MLAELLFTASMSFAAAPVHIVECTAMQDKETLQLRIDGEFLSVSFKANPPTQFAILSNKVEGKGAKARKTIKLENGEISYKEVFGCLRDAKATLDGNKLKDVKCKNQSGPQCKDGTKAATPKADK